jgi:hypothetical protein
MRRAGCGDTDTGEAVHAGGLRQAANLRCAQTASRVRAAGMRLRPVPAARLVYPTWPRSETASGGDGQAHCGGWDNAPRRAPVNERLLDAAAVAERLSGDAGVRTSRPEGAVQAGDPVWL